MSFILDLPLLFIAGAALYLAGKRYRLERLTKITIGLIIVLAFISFSALLYADVFRVDIPPLKINMNGSEFMLHTKSPMIPSTGVSPAHFPLLFVVLLFILYPLAIFFGYAFMLSCSKRRNRRLLPGSRSYEDVRSRTRISREPEYSVVRYPDGPHGINNLKEAVEEAVDDLGGIRNFVRQGDRVLIKANICGGNPDIPATYTSQEVVGYVVDMVREAGGEPFVCDADMVWAKFWVQVRGEGWDEWARRKKVELINLTETELVYFDFGEGTMFSNNERPNHEIVSTRVLDADVIISIPKMKTHFGSSVTLGMKNMYGTLPEEDKAFYHQKGGVEELLYWVNYAFTPTLTIIDGSEGGEAEGPLAAHSVQFNTIIASNNVVYADAIAAKLMGYEHPFEDIKFLRFAKEMIGDARSLLQAIPKEMHYTAAQLISKWELPPNSRDGKWQLPIPEVAEETWTFMENLLGFPGMPTLFSIGADFVLLDAARLPYWRILQSALMQILFAPRFWLRKAKETALDRSRKRINLAIFAIIALVSLRFFAGYLPEDLAGLNASLGYILGFVLALLLGGFFSSMMHTKHLVAITLSSMIVAYFVESFAPYAAWWVYLIDGKKLVTGWFGLPLPPNYPLFAIPIFIISIIGLAHVLRPVLFSLKGRRFRLVPYAAIMLALALFLYLEGYLTPGAADLSDPTRNMIIIYAALAILGLYFNEKQDLDWNLALVMVAVALGFVMEYLGALAGYWGYPRTMGLGADNWGQYDLILKTSKSGFTWLPMFVSLSWVLNTWAACGLAQIFGIDMSRAFVKDETFDATDPRALVRKGDSLVVEGEYSTAIERYDEAIFLLTCIDRDENGERSLQVNRSLGAESSLVLGDAWGGKGAALASLGDFASSLMACEKAIEQYIDLYPDFAGTQLAEAWYHKALALQNLALQGCGRLQKGGRELSQRDAEKALLAEEALHAFGKALDACRQAMSGVPQAADRYIDIMVDETLLLQRLGRFEESIAAYDEALALFKGNTSKLAEIYVFKGFSEVHWADVNLSESLYKKAIEDFNSARELCSRTSDADRITLASAGWGIGYARSRLERYAKAGEGSEGPILDALRQSIMDLGERNAAFVYSDLGDACIDQERHEEALKAYEKALDLYPEIENIRIAQAWKGRQEEISKFAAHLWEGMGDAQSRIADRIRSDSIESTSIQKLERAEEDSALKAYRRAVEILDRFPGDSDALAGKGLVLLKMARYREALMAYEKAALIASDAAQPAAAPMALLSAARALTGKGEALAKMGEKDKARLAFCQALERVLDYPPALHGMSTLPGAGDADSKARDMRYSEVWQHRGAYLAIMKSIRLYLSADLRD